MFKAALCLVGALISSASLAQDAPAFSKADAGKVLKATKAGNAAGITRLAVTSCNVLFGVETSANSETQAGFGENNRVEAMVSSTYALQGLDNAAMQALADSICADAEAQLGAAYSVVPAAEVAASPAFAKLHAGGKPTPLTYERAGAKYLVFAPAGQSVVDMMYQNLSAIGTFGAIAKTISSGGGSEADEAALLTSLGASGARINVMVDFAKQKGSKAKGFLGKMTGNSEAKVETKLSLSVSGFVRMSPVDRVKSYSGGVQLIDDAELVRFTTQAPLQSEANVVLAVSDIQTGGSKAGELGANVLAGAMALSGIKTSTTSIERNGVTVDTALYSSEVRRLSQQLVAMSVALAKP